ncbi:ATP synthase epsilon chain [Spirochaetia bacterium]|nr:ATP synthase epsilon chain [Spirochaetia bacterium]
MAGAKFKFEVYTPYRLFFSQDVEAITLRLSDGEVGIYAGHSLFTAPVVNCIMKIKDRKGVWKHAFVSNGIIEVKKTKTVLLSDAAEWPEEIDAERAKKSKDDAMSVIKDSSFKFENAIAGAKLERAEMRLKVLESVVKPSV